MGIPRDFKPANVLDPRISVYYHNCSSEQKDKLQEAHRKSLKESGVPPTDPVEKKKLARKLIKDLEGLLCQMKDGLGWDGVVALYTNQDDDTLDKACFSNSSKFDLFHPSAAHV